MCREPSIIFGGALRDRRAGAGHTEGTMQRSRPSPSDRPVRLTDVEPDQLVSAPWAAVTVLAVERESLRELFEPRVGVGQGDL